MQGGARFETTKSCSQRVLRETGARCVESACRSHLRVPGNGASSETNRIAATKHSRNRRPKKREFDDSARQLVNRFEMGDTWGPTAPERLKNCCLKNRWSVPTPRAANERRSASPSGGATAPAKSRELPGQALSVRRLGCLLGSIVEVGGAGCVISQQL